jgi:hypothetical protein
MATRNRKGQMERDLAQALLDTEAAELRANRWTYPQIAAHQKCSVSTAHDRVQRAIASVPYEAVDKLRRLELESLDEQERRMLKVQEAVHVKTYQGDLILINGEPLLDDGPVLDAGMAILRIKDMRAKLTGEYAPTKTTLTVVPEDTLTAEIQRLEAQLADPARDDRSTPREASAAERTASAGS